MMVKLLGLNLSVLYFFQIIVVIFLSVGFLPYYYSWIIVLMAAYFFYKEPLENCLYYFVLSIPFFVATPIFSLESFSLWRPISALMFIKYFAKNYHIFRLFNLFNGKLFFKDVKNYLFNLRNFNTELFILIVFFIISLSGLFFAKDKIAVVKTTLYYFNIALIGFIVYQVTKNKEVFENILKGFLVNLFIVLAIAILQVTSVFFISLADFWNFWAKGPVVAYYGETLSKHLLVSNTWFSYWPGNFATLRAFSIFQDSHAFGLFLVLSLMPTGYFILLKRFSVFKLKPIVLAILTLLFIVLSGTRGLWVAFYAILIPVLALAIFYFKNKNLIKFKNNIFIFVLLFTACFFISSGLWFLQIYAQNLSTSPANIFLAFQRVKSSFDLEEVSNKGRVEIWQKSFQSFVKNPILGIGSGNFPLALQEKISYSKKGSSAHNLYLQFLVENGILGFLTILFLFYKILLKTYKESEKGNFFAIVFFVVLIWIFGYNLFDVALLNDKILIVFTIVISLFYKSLIFKYSKVNS